MASYSQHPLGSSQATEELPYGQRLLPTLLDHIATIDPDRPFVVLPRNNDDLKQGYVPLTFASLTRAIDRLAWLLEPKLSRLDLRPPASSTVTGASKKAPVVGYIGIDDVRNNIFLAAMLKLGYIPLFLSEQYGTAGNLSLLKSAECTTLVCSTGIEDTVTEIEHEHEVAKLTIPPLSDLLTPPSPTDKPFSYTRTYTSAKNDIFCIVGTSGTTGLPKPSAIAYSRLFLMDTFHEIRHPITGQGVSQTTCVDGMRAWMPMPHYHAAGTLFLFFLGAYCNAVMVEHPLGRRLELDVVCDVIVHGSVQRGLLPPWICKMLDGSEDGRTAAGRLESLVCTGGPLDHTAGQVLSKLTHVFNSLASTEYNYIQYIAPPQDWEYYYFADKNGIEWRRINDEQELYELTFVKNERYERWQQPFFGLEEGVREIPTNDVFTPHPTKGWLWKAAGRKDDMFTFGDGLNFHPGNFEKIVKSHPSVKEAIMLGQGRMDSVLLVELDDPKSAESDREAVLDEIYPTVERAWRENGNKPVTRVARDRVIFAKPGLGKAFVRTAKGSVSKRKTVEVFWGEIEGLDSTE